MAKFLIFTLTLLLSSCASVPFGTMLEFRSFGKEDFLNIQPQDIRAKIQVDEPVRADLSQAELSLELNLAKGTSFYKFPLILLEEKTIEPVAGFFSKSAGKTEYALQLTDEAMQNFKATQHILLNEQSGSFKFSVKTGFEELPKQLKEIRLSMFLKLSEDRDFVTLFENAKLEIKHEG